MRFALIAVLFLGGCLFIESEDPGPPLVCGDGLAEWNYEESEGCDDGNRTSGDGCSSTCETEPGILATWTLHGTTTTCRSATDRVEIHAAAELPGHDSHMTTASCASGETRFSVHETTFSVSMRLTDANGVVYAQSQPSRHYISQSTLVAHSFDVP